LLSKQDTYKSERGTANSDAEILDLDWYSRGLPGKYGHPVSGRVISFFLFFLQRREALLSFSKNNQDLNANFSDPPLVVKYRDFQKQVRTVVDCQDIWLEEATG